MFEVANKRKAAAIQQLLLILSNVIITGDYQV